MRVFVYRNIRRKCWSVKALEGPQKGRVIGHRDMLSLHCVTARVSEAGRRRVLRTQQKAVHAGLVGHTILEGPAHAPNAVKGEVAVPVRYNPYEMATFQDEKGKPVAGASRVFFGPDGTVTAVGPIYLES